MSEQRIKYRTINDEGKQNLIFRDSQLLLPARQQTAYIRRADRWRRLMPLISDIITDFHRSTTSAPNEFFVNGIYVMNWKLNKLPTCDRAYQVLWKSIQAHIHFFHTHQTTGPRKCRSDDRRISWILIQRFCYGIELISQKSTKKVNVDSKPSERK